MDYQEFIANLPSNQIHKYDDINLFLHIYSHLYPTEEEREEIYRLEDCIFPHRNPFCDFPRVPDQSINLIHLPVE